MTKWPNSTARADRLRAMVEAACGDLIRHREREQTDPLELLARGVPVAPPEPSPPEALAIVREMKDRHYDAWLDTPLPALEGESPRAAMRTAAGRARVDVLLKDLENRESRLPEEERFDVEGLRARLGLEETR